MESLELGAEKGVRIEVEKTQETEQVEAKQKEEQERVSKQRQQERDEESSFWTTAGMRPLAEPPILDWDWFFRERVVSDIRYRALFPNDLGKRAAAKDIGGERCALFEYMTWAAIMRDDPEIDRYARHEFHENLAEDLQGDWLEFEKDTNALFAQASKLSQFKYAFLDSDGRTTKIEEVLQKGVDIFAGFKDAEQRYRHLMPLGFKPSPYATFEFHCLDPAGGNSRIEHILSNGHDILAKWPDKEIQEKYGHLRSFLPGPGTAFPSTPVGHTLSHL